MLVIRVGDHHLDDSVGETVGQVRLGFQTVFETLAGEDDLAVHAVLAAALGGFPDHIFDHGRHVTADLRLVGLDRVGVDGLRAGVGQLRAVLAGGAERDLVVRFDVEVVAHLARPGPVGVVRATGANGGAKENLPSAILFALLGIPSLLGIILSIVRRKNQDSILQFRKTTYYPVLLTVAVAVGAAAPDMVDVFVSAVFALILTEQARDIWDMWVEKPSSAWA